MKLDAYIQIPEADLEAKRQLIKQGQAHRKFQRDPADRVHPTDGQTNRHVWHIGSLGWDGVREHLYAMLRRLRALQANRPRRRQLGIVDHVRRQRDVWLLVRPILGALEWKPGRLLARELSERPLTPK